MTSLIIEDKIKGVKTPLISQLTFKKLNLIVYAATNNHYRPDSSL